MKLSEYEKVKDMDYLEYCDYLQAKYGIGRSDYMTPNWNRKNGVTRTSEGLFVHHKYEDHAIMLSSKEWAMNNPFEWQRAENIVYCDFLEHLLLHVLICENPSPEQNKNEYVGVGGVVNHIVPELNDVYSGWQAKRPWQAKCHALIKDDKDVYLTILKRFKQYMKHPLYPLPENCLLTSINDQYGTWSIRKNKRMFREIKAL